MAIIICNDCGKKVSDTAQTCIHCGARLKADISEKVHTPTTDAREPQEESENSLRDYKSLSDEEKIKLEKEFLEQHPSLYATRRKELEIPRFTNTSLLFLCLSILPMLFALIVSKVGEVYDEALTRTAIKSGLVYFFFSAVAMLVTGIRKLKNQYSPMRMAYKKKYQLWLKNERRIRYDPFFMNDKEKAVFDETELETPDI